MNRPTLDIKAQTDLIVSAAWTYGSADPVVQLVNSTCEMWRSAVGTDEGAQEQVRNAIGELAENVRDAAVRAARAGIVDVERALERAYDTLRENARL